MAGTTDTSHGPATVHAAAALAVEYADRLVLRTVRDMHRAVSRRSFSMTGPASLPSRYAHDAVSGSVYGIVGASLRTTGAALRYADRRGHGRPLDTRPAGRREAAVVNGLVGESLHETRHPMAITMAARKDGYDVTDLAAAYPNAGGDVVVFLHGLVEDDESWTRDAATSGGTYADRLERDTGWTSVTMRYNSGLPIASNGELLSDWLNWLLAGWPTPVRRIALVGHSMGGLVALAACRGGSAGDLAWAPLVRHVVCLGTPHLGAPLERAVHWGSRGLLAFPESAPFAAILETRSRGIRDLGRGDPDCVPLPGASYHCVSAGLPGPVGLILGDLLVRRTSATGRIAGATSRHLPGTHHFTLLNHPEVYADLRRRLTAGDVSVQPG